MKAESIFPVPLVTNVEKNRENCKKIAHQKYGFMITQRKNEMV